VSEDLTDPATTAEDRYRPVLGAQTHSETLREIWQDVYGTDCAPGVEPLGFSTLTELRRMAEWIGVGDGDTFADLGCGRGGPGLWLARETGAAVLGIDIAEEAVIAARQRAPYFGLEPSRARYQVASITDTGLQSGNLDAALSVDALWMVLDKPAAAAEVARILSPGARWVLTTWQPTYFRYRTLLADAGFEILLHEEPLDWRTRQRSVYEAIVRQRGRLADELGPAAAAVLVDEALEIMPRLAHYQRLLIVARR
jgi:ubiquinone/menaquinone biosynthesis C-methylase UbiE